MEPAGEKDCSCSLCSEVFPFDEDFAQGKVFVHQDLFIFCSEECLLEWCQLVLEIKTVEKSQGEKLQKENGGYFIVPESKTLQTI